ncbi:MAG: AbrB/MazE/SpoVT family DNA-binding domain-containing protein [Vulcanisaeta sp.]|jgi:AbrB family looped-hinge helix DNA binding protein|nr:AbrB/MazE/SpoVT family DNA-binding domain-containing protein [Vulcanisaeta sp.]MCG2870479.1 AbrB/MazE/SpoVT family DNA-binding domain-containing protein [Vulcanisaeta sp.]MCG2887379.1 AbrB/MazE/SpoVT family DNA-binding domain-containing protein [Vulcanisaeta sp.]
MDSQVLRRRGAPGIRVTRLPYRVRVYLNNQVLIPASLVRALGISGLRYAVITLSYNGVVITLNGVKLLRTKHTDSRQFTIPREVREKYGIKPGDEVEILDIRPYRL